MEPFLFLFLLIIQSGISCYARKNHLCAPSVCGEIRNLSYPFRLKDDPKSCGDSVLELSCEDNRAILSLYAGQYHVKRISPPDNYEGFISGYIQVVDVGLQRSNCSSLPLHPLMPSNFSGKASESSYYIGDDFSSFAELYISHRVWTVWATILSCSKQVKSPWYISTKPCIVEEGYYSYAVINANASDIEDSCTITTSILAAEYLPEEAASLSQENRTISYYDIHNAMADGFNLSYWVVSRMKILFSVS